MRRAGLRRADELAVPYARPLPLLSGAASADGTSERCVTRSPAAPTAVAYISPPCDALSPTPQINGPQIRTASVRIKRPPGSCAAAAAAAFYDDDADALLFTFVVNVDRQN